MDNRPHKQEFTSIIVCTRLDNLRPKCYNANKEIIQVGVGSPWCARKIFITALAKIKVGMSILTNFNSCGFLSVTSDYDSYKDWALVDMSAYSLI